MASPTGNHSKYEFLTGRDVLLENDLLQKAATIKGYEYSSLESDFKKHIDTAKDQYKLLKDQNNDVIDSHKEDGVKTEYDEIIDNARSRYIYDKYRDLINNIFINGLKDAHLHHKF